MSYPTDRKYTRDHEWIRVNGDVADVGITDFAQKQLGDVVFLELPAVGHPLNANGALGTIESVKAVSELFAPASGTITEVNADSVQRPESVNQAAHDTWLVRLRLSNPAELNDLLDAAQYETHIRSAE